MKEREGGRKKEGGREIEGKRKKMEREEYIQNMCCLHTNTCMSYLTQCNELPVGEFASCVAIEIAMNIHKLLSPDWLLADAKYSTNFLPHNHKHVNVRIVSH